MCAGSIVLAAVAPLFSSAVLGLIQGVTIMAFNALAIALALRKAAASPSERAGWRFFALGAALSMLGNGFWLIFSPAFLDTGLGRTLLLGSSLLSGGALAVAAGAWPWREREDRGVLLSLLGSLVFCLSFFLLPWVRGVGGQTPSGLLSLISGSRLILAGGVASFLVAEDSRRLRGPLGWVLLHCSLFYLQMAFFAHGIARLGLAARSIGFGFTPLIAGALLLAAYTPHPVEVPEGGSPEPARSSGLLLFVPFLAVAVLIGTAIARGEPLRAGPILGFLLLTAALVVRQALLQEQLWTSHLEMEARVASRTRELERLQDVVLLNERLNAVVVLGAGLVHDLNKGLGSILSAAEVLQMEMERRMKVSGFAVEAIIQAVDRSAMLTSRVMDFSRRLQEEGEVRDLRRELAALEGLLRLLIPCGVHLLLQPGLEPAPVRIHTEDLKQILVNLVANARDALPGGGTIRVAVGKESRTGETYLDVEDTGTGIADEHVDRLFEPFFTTKEPGTGTGLGLASVKVLLEKSQGRVEVSSSVGAGTRFRLLFPAAPVHA